MATEVISPSPPVATFGPRPTSFQKNPRICGERWRILRKRWCILEKSGGFEANSQDASFGETMADFS